MTAPLVFFTQSYTYLRDQLAPSGGLEVGSIELFARVLARALEELA